MRVLLIENNPVDAGILLGAMDQSQNAVVDIAESLETARELIERRHSEYDLAIFDLQIPTTDGALDEHVDHGLAAFVQLGRIAPGTIRFVWTGKATDEAFEQIVMEQDKADPLGTNNPEPMVKFFSKAKLRDCIDCLNEISQSMAVLDEIQWSWGLTPQDVEPMTKRVVDIFARRQKGAQVHVGTLGDGQSGSTVLRLKVISEEGVTTASVVGKVDDLQEVKEELSRYGRHVAPSLKPGAYATLGDDVLVGADGLGGAFYKLVDPDAKSLFEIAANDPEKAADAVRRLAENLTPWCDGVPQKRVPVRDVRRAILSDGVAESIDGKLGLERQSVEDAEVFIHEATVHGDLHGLNVLVDSDGNPILIDYAQVMKASAALDPLTLELSAILHPKSPLRGFWNDADPTLWMKSADFFADCPHAAFFEALRKWGHDVAASDGEVCAAAYSYCLRQLKYDDVDHEVAAQLARSAAAALPNK